MASEAERSIKVVVLLVKSILRRNTHLTLLISLSALLLLTVILYSLPSPALLLENYLSSALKDVNVVVASRENAGEECIKASVVEAYLDGHGLVALVYSEVIAKRFTDVLKFNETGCTCSGFTVSLPRNLYVSLNRACDVELKINGECRSYCVKYTHELLEAVIVLNSTQGFHRSNPYLCLTSKFEVVRSTLMELENSVLNTVDIWLLLLLIASLPGVYVASIRVLLSIKSELKVLLNAGLSKATITLCCTFILWVLEALAVIFLLSLSTVIVYSASTALSTLFPVSIPTFRPMRILRFTLLIFASTYFVSLIASRRFAENGGLL